MTDVYMNIGDFDTPDDIHNLFTETFEFPSWYGRNFDALHDMLTSLTEETCIHIDYEGKTLPELPECAIRCLRGLYDSADENPQLTIRRADEETD